MSQLSQALAQAAYKNSELLSILAQTDYAPSSLQQNSGYITDLKAQISKNDQDLNKLHAITEDERKDHVKYRDSTVKRFAFRLGGQKGKDKYAGKAEKEEREFLEAWQKEREASETKDELERALKNAENDKVRLESESSRHDGAQKELDALYQQIFSGPTPDVPGEDQLEQSVQQCREWLDTCQNGAGREKQALEILQQAEQALKTGNTFMGEALSASQWDMLGGGTFIDMMERDALANAQNQIMHATRYMIEATRLQPAIRGLSDVTIDHGHIFGDVLFDNIFSDMAQHDRIAMSHQQLQKATQELQLQVSEQKQRLQGVQHQLQQAKDNIENARRELQDIRSQAFEQYAGSQTAEGPPVYQA